MPRRAFVIASLLFVTSSSQAHFKLQSPPSWMSQDSLGSPQKLGPCGDEDDGTSASTPTGVVTAYQVGDTVTITIDETIFHPGHYRIALAVNDRSELPHRARGRRRRRLRRAAAPHREHRRSSRCSRTTSSRTRHRSRARRRPGPASAQRHVRTLHAPGHRVHVRPPAQQSGRLLLSPLRRPRRGRRRGHEPANRSGRGAGARAPIGLQLRSGAELELGLRRAVRDRYWLILRLPSITPTEMPMT